MGPRDTISHVGLFRDGVETLLMRAVKQSTYIFLKLKDHIFITPQIECPPQLLTKNANF